RIVLGVGAGWVEPEFEAVGAAFSERGRRTDTSLGIIRDLFEGRDLGGVFEPALRAPLPVMIGGMTGAALRRAARYGDEWQGLGLDGAGFAAAVEKLRSYGDRPVRVGTRLDWSAGDPDPIVAMAHELADAGAETLAVSFGDESDALDRMTRFHAMFTAG
ncbi:MAG TPA: LLM class flavin-dependent oxidoreductase, partial [Kribbella sp.]